MGEFILFLPIILVLLIGAPLGKMKYDAELREQQRVIEVNNTWADLG